MITDDDLIAFLRERPARLVRICEHFGLPYRPPPYTPEAKAIRKQLQRLRYARRLETDQGQRWSVREGQKDG